MASAFLKRPLDQSLKFTYQNEPRYFPHQYPTNIMNAFGTLALNYLLFTLVSSTVLYGAFRKKLDTSAVYFLISELFVFFTSVMIFIQNYYPNLHSNSLNAVANFFSLSCEIAILFSILSLRGKTHLKHFLQPVFVVALFAVFLEIIRPNVELKLLVLLYTIAQTCLFLYVYLVCRFKLPTGLAKNQFIVSFRWFELGLLIYSIIRLLSYFSSMPIIPRETPSFLAVAIFASYITLSSFRYMSYIGLRMTWIDPFHPTPNSLNRDLAKAIEEKDQLLRGLIASNRVIGISALASSLAHQLSQPLTAIALQADTARRELGKTTQNPALTGPLDDISLQSGKLAELVKNLRQLFSSRSYQFDAVSLQKAVDEIIDIVEPTLQAKKITLIKGYQSNPLFFGDAIQIQQVLINVFNNAIDVISSSALSNQEIKLTITQDEKFAILTIEDSGAGISAALLPTIFELYKTTKQGGLGVGLWLSKTIMERHHGSITASNSQAGGAVFEIRIPLSKTIGN